MAPQDLSHARQRQLTATPAVLRDVSAPEARIDPLDQPPSADLLEGWGVQRALSTGCLPWRAMGREVIVLAPSRGCFDAQSAALADCFGAVRFAAADQLRCQEAIQRLADPTLARAAESRPLPDHSCRNFRAGATARWFIALVAFCLSWAILDLAGLVLALSALATTAALAGSLYKLTAAVAHRTAPPSPPDPPLAQDDTAPMISILVPLFREEHIAEHLLARLARLTYPRDRIEVVLITERGDKITQDAIARTELPPWMRVISVPKGSCQTKPRAMNYALDFTRGEIIGIYDAEDAPEPDQLLRVARRFAVAPPETACLQGVLDYYNTESNWLSRCFTIEYAAWFRVVMPGLQRLGLILPLGGTTLFVRRSVLEKVGAWDAHNVTEDADLGVRLARMGYRTEMVATATFEEANARLWPWIKQRSRWLKGYAVTYWVAMRRPRRLLREIGLRRVIGLNLQFAATLSTFLLAPILWSFWLAMLGMPHPFMELIGRWGVYMLTGFFLLAELVTITLGAMGAQASGRPWLMKWAPLMHFYYPLAAFACYKAFYELAIRPFYWDKTAHGIFHPTQRQNDDQFTFAASSLSRVIKA